MSVFLIVSSVFGHSYYVKYQRKLFSFKKLQLAIHTTQNKETSQQGTCQRIYSSYSRELNNRIYVIQGFILELLKKIDQHSVLAKTSAVNVYCCKLLPLVILELWVRTLSPQDWHPLSKTYGSARH